MFVSDVCVQCTVVSIVCFQKHGIFGAQVDEADVNVHKTLSFHGFHKPDE